jgi:hypothetical protein
MTPGESQALVSLAIVLLVNTLSLSLLVLRSRWHGWRLAGLIFLMYFGVFSFLSTIEALVFNTALEIQPNLLWFNLVSALILALVFAPLSVWWFGKWKPATDPPRSEPLGKGLPRKQLVIKLLALAALVYPFLYISFGYFIAWQNPDVRLLYTGSTEMLPFWTQAWNAFANPVWFYPFQIGRAFIWIGLAWLAMRASKAGWAETGLVVGINFALLMNAQHLLPNPFMTESIRLSHFLETAISNFIWGFVIVWVLHRPHSSFADLFRHNPNKRDNKSS